MRICLNCSSKTTRIHKTKNGTPYEHWAKYKDGFICNRCYEKLINRPKRNARLLRWTPIDKQIPLKVNPRKGICQICGKVGKTNIHHFAEYHDDDPLKDTIELCVPCHNKQHIRQRDLKGRFI